MVAREGEVWVGAFGRWYPWRWESEEAEEEERKGRLANGVMGMDVEEDSVKGELALAAGWTGRVAWADSLGLRLQTSHRPSELRPT